MDNLPRIGGGGALPKEGGGGESIAANSHFTREKGSMAAARGRGGGAGGPGF